MYMHNNSSSIVQYNIVRVSVCNSTQVVDN